MSEKKTEKKNISKSGLIAIMAAMLGLLHLVLIAIATFRGEANMAIVGIWLAALVMILEFVFAALAKRGKSKKVLVFGLVLLALNVGLFFIPACDYSKYSGCKEFCESSEVECDCLTSGANLANIYGF